MSQHPAVATQSVTHSRLVWCNCQNLTAVTGNQTSTLIPSDARALSGSLVLSYEIDVPLAFIPEMRDTLLQNAASALYQSYRERFEVTDQQVIAVARLNQCCRVNFLTIVLQIQSSDGLAVSSAVDIAGADGAATLNLLLRSSFNQSTMFSNDSIDALLWIQMGLECLDNAGCDCVIYAKSNSRCIDRSVSPLCLLISEQHLLSVLSVPSARATAGFEPRPCVRSELFSASQQHVLICRSTGLQFSLSAGPGSPAGSPSRLCLVKHT